MFSLPSAHTTLNVIAARYRAERASSALLGKQGRVLRFVKRLVSNGPSPFQDEAIDATIPPMGERDAAQAVALIRALCDLLDEMTRQLTWLEHRDARGEAAALRQDINEAQTHINGLQRRYLNSDRHAHARQLAKQAR